MKGIIINRNPGFAKAIALFPFIITKSKDKRTLNHENIHIRQQLELLVIPFYLWYIIEYLIHRFKGKSDFQAYKSISFEKEAFENDDNLDYLKTRRFWSFIKYIKVDKSK